ncbi:mRNA export factor GLE1-like isoform X2 [Acropora muricata]
MNGTAEQEVVTAQKKRASPMTWTSEKDEALCKEILLLEPFRFRPRTKESGTTWSQVAEDLRQIKSLNMTVDQRAVRDRYKILKSHFLQKMTDEEKGSGIAPPELTPVEAALEEIIEKEKEFEKQCSSEDSDKKEKAEKDRKNGEEMRQESLETFAQTKKRKLLNGEEDDIETPKVRTNRRSGADTLAYLKEKSDKEMEVKKEELQIKKKLQEEQLMEQRSMRQQQAHMVEAFSAMQQSMQRQLQQQTELQQQQQQQNSQLIMMMMQMIQNKKNN